MNNWNREDVLTLEILSAIGERSDVTQRSLASHTGVALGLANSYLKRCVKKGLVKIKQAPANRYLYYLTPKGFAEKSRLTAQYLSYSFTFYRSAGDSCIRVFSACLNNQWTALGLYGLSDLAEIAAVRALDSEVKIRAIYDAAEKCGTYLKIPVVNDVALVRRLDAWVITDLSDPVGSYEALSKKWQEERILIPDILTGQIGRLPANKNV